MAQADVIYLYYPVNDYRRYLAHHGIKGMKWGVRRYQNYDGTLTAAGKARIAGDGQGFKARMKIRGQNFVDTQKDIFRSTKAANGVINKASELVGHGRGETVARNHMYAQERLKNASKTRLGKHLHDVSGYNYKSAAEYHSIKRGQKLGRRVGELFVPVTAYKMPIKTITGRKTTLGMEVLTNAIAGPIGSAALAGTYHGSKIASKKLGTSGKIHKSIDKHVDRRASESYSKAKASYDKSQKDISDYEERKAAKVKNGNIGNSVVISDIGQMSSGSRKKKAR